MRPVKPALEPHILTSRPREDERGSRTEERGTLEWPALREVDADHASLPRDSYPRRDGLVDRLPMGAGLAPDAADCPTRAFLIACLRGRWQPDALGAARAGVPQDAAGWEAVRVAANNAWLAPLLHRVTCGQDLVPAALEEQWRSVYLQSLQRSARLFHELEALLRSMAAAGVPVMLLKGAALAEAVYGDVALRPMTDLDLLVRPRDVPAALSVLRVAGYKTDEPFRYFAEVGAHKMGATPVLVDLHWAWIDLPYYIDVIDADWLWGTARQISTGGTPALMLGPEAQLLHLAAHMVLKENDDAGRSSTSMTWPRCCISTQVRLIGKCCWLAPGLLTSFCRCSGCCRLWPPDGSLQCRRMF